MCWVGLLYKYVANRSNKYWLYAFYYGISVDYVYAYTIEQLVKFGKRSGTFYGPESVCLSVRLSQVCVLSKRLNKGSQNNVAQ